MILWMQPVPNSRAHLVAAKCYACGTLTERKLVCDTGATTSAANALAACGWVPFEIRGARGLRFRKVGLCPECAEKVPWLVELVAKAAEEP